MYSINLLMIYTSDNNLAKVVIMIAPIILPFIVLGCLIKMSKTKVNAVEIREYIKDVSITERNDINTGTVTTTDSMLSPLRSKTSYISRSENMNNLNMITNAIKGTDTSISIKGSEQ